MSDKRRPSRPRIRQPRQAAGGKAPRKGPRVQAGRAGLRRWHGQARLRVAKLGRGGRLLAMLVVLLLIAGGISLFHHQGGEYRPVAAGPALTPAEEMADAEGTDESEEAADEEAAEEKENGPTRPDRAPPVPAPRSPPAGPAVTPTGEPTPKPSSTAAAPAPQMAALPRPPLPLPAPSPAPHGTPAWQQHARPAPAADGRPRIVIVIDDMGLDRKRSDKVQALPGPLTLAWLPYAHDLPQQTARARAAGHELIVHMPMEPSGTADPGPDALLTRLGEAELRRRLALHLSAFDGFVGINNHMGSRFTADRRGMAVVLSELASRGLLFLDSRTTADSAAAPLAAHYHVPMLARDVFLDHQQSPKAVAAALAQVEAIARRKGSAIAIGHPHDVTSAALAAWLPTLEAKGFQLVPLTALIKEHGANGTKLGG